MPLPRQAYGIDSYGHEKGEILVAVDLCTREATLWFLPNRKQDHVARALMTGLITFPPRTIEIRDFCSRLVMSKE